MIDFGFNGDGGRNKGHINDATLVLVMTALGAAIVLGLFVLATWG